MLKMKGKEMLSRVTGMLSLALCLLLASPIAASAKEVNSYDIVGLSSDGLRVVSSRTSAQKGYINEEGQIIVPLEYTYASDFTNGVGLLRKKDGRGDHIFSAVNTKGETIIVFDQALGEIEYFDGKHGIAVKSFGAESAGRFALIDGAGQLVTGYDYDSLYVQGEPGTYEVLFAEERDTGRKGMLNWDGSTIIPMEYTYIQNSARWNPNILAVVRQAGDNDYRCGYLYSNGVELLPSIYDEAEIFTEGFGAVEKDHKWAAINAQGQFITDFSFDYLDAFREGVAVIWKEGKYGVIDTTGKEIVPCNYDQISRFAGGYAKAELEGEGLLMENPLIKMRDINIYKGEKWIYTEQEPFLEAGRVFAPFRAIAEAMDYSVRWNSSTKQITVQNKERIIHFTVGSKEASVNIFDDGRPAEVVLLDAAPKIVNGSTMIPVRAIVECTGASVEWDAANRVVKIN